LVTVFLKLNLGVGPAAAGQTGSEHCAHVERGLQALERQRVLEDVDVTLRYLRMSILGKGAHQHAAADQAGAAEGDLAQEVRAPEGLLGALLQGAVDVDLFEREYRLSGVRHVARPPEDVDGSVVETFPCYVDCDLQYPADQL